MIDFEDLAGQTGQGGLVEPSYTKDGFLLQHGTGEAAAFYVVSNNVQDGFYQGSTAIFNVNAGGNTILTKADNSAFDIFSIDLTNYGNGNSINTLDVTFTGSLLGGGTVSQTFAVDDFNGFQTFNFTGFTNLASVSVVTGIPNAIEFDNINVSAVPLPAAVWLMGSGLVGLLGLHKKQTLNA
ncbi:MAG: hypothetical protein ABL903_13620 [Methylococcales bacterium]